MIYQRHRHRYEVNNLLRRRLEDAGLVFSGTSPDDRLVEVIELPDHPFFMASQYHPEFKSRPNRPEPLFREFVGAALERARERGTAERRRRGARRGPASATRTGRAGLDRGHTGEPAEAAPPAPSGRRLARHVRTRSARSRARAGERREAARGSCDRELRGARPRREEDDTAAETGAGVRQPARAHPGPAGRSRTVMLCAHIDTVPLADRIEVELVDGVYRNRHDAILGADNKAAVAVLLEIARGAPCRAAAGRRGAASSRPARRSACAARRRSTSRALEAEFGYASRPRVADRRADRGGADVLPR